MAAAGSAVFRPSRGLLILSLLCLVGLGDSLVKMDTLEKLMEQLRNIMKGAESMKEDSFYSDILTETQRSLNTMLNICQRAPPEMKPLQAVLQIVKVFVDEALAAEENHDEF